MTTFAIEIGNKMSNVNQMTMKKLVLKSETDLEEKVIELTKSGAHFRVIGRRAILLF